MSSPEGDDETGSPHALESVRDVDPVRVQAREDDASQRIDKVLAKHLSDRSRTVIQRWIADGRVRMDGQVCTLKSKVRAGSTIEAIPEPPPTTRVEPQDIPIDVRFEDEHLLVVDKPAGLVVHPAPGHLDGTLVNAVLHHTNAVVGQDNPRPGIVHRLDKDTSGVMVVAKTPKAHEGLVALFQAHDIERAYVALVWGRVETALTYDTNHRRHPKHRKRFTTQGEWYDGAPGKRAVTHVTPMDTLEVASRVRCTLETGRTHQIRVHLSEHGHPVVGDPVYGRRPKDPLLRAIDDDLGRQALHAEVLGFTHPVTGERVRVQVPPPEDFMEAWRKLNDFAG